MIPWASPIQTDWNKKEALAVRMILEGEVHSKEVRKLEFCCSSLGEVKMEDVEKKDVQQDVVILRCFVSDWAWLIGRGDLSLGILRIVRG